MQERVTVVISVVERDSGTNLARASLVNVREEIAIARRSTSVIWVHFDAC